MSDQLTCRFCRKAIPKGEPYVYCHLNFGKAEGEEIQVDMCEECDDKNFNDEEGRLYILEKMLIPRERDIEDTEANFSERSTEKVEKQ